MGLNRKPISRKKRAVVNLWSEQHPYSSAQLNNGHRIVDMNPNKSLLRGRASLECIQVLSKVELCDLVEFVGIKLPPDAQRLELGDGLGNGGFTHRVLASKPIQGCHGVADLLSNLIDGVLKRCGFPCNQQFCLPSSAKCRSIPDRNLEC